MPRTFRPIARTGGAVSALVLVLLGVALLAAGGWYVFWPRSQPLDSASVLVHTVAEGPFVHEVIEQGEIESSDNVEVKCEVKSRNTSGTAIIEVVAEGKMVEPGDVLVRLDSSALENELVQQQILKNNAESALVQATNELEAAEISKREYLEGTFAQEEQVILNEVFVAEENLRRAKQYVEYSERLAIRGYITTLQLEGDRFAVEKARNDLAAANTRLRVLREYTRAKMLKQLEAAIKTAASKQSTERQRLSLEVENLALVKQQIAKCTIVAPSAGQVVYANLVNTGNSDFIVEPGALVRERQTIVRLPTASKMQVKAKINETKLAFVQPGMKVKVRIDAFGDKPLTGTVERINAYPEPANRYGSQIKMYAAFIRVDSPPAYVKAGLTAEVRIQVEQRASALQIPVQAVNDHGGRPYCVVRENDQLVPKFLELETTNDQFVVVKSGVQPGEVVLLNPLTQKRHYSLPELPAIALAKSANPVPAPADVTTSAAAPKATEPARKTRPAPGAIAQRVLTDLDRNGDGVLQANEITGERAAQLSAADSNQDGQVDRAELSAAFARRSSPEPGGE